MTHRFSVRLLVREGTELHSSSSSQPFLHTLGSIVLKPFLCGVGMLRGDPTVSDETVLNSLESEALRANSTTEANTIRILRSLG